MVERKFGVPFFFFKYFIYLALAALSLYHSACFSLAVEIGGAHCLVVVWGCLIMGASLVVAHRL